MKKKMLQFVDLIQETPEKRSTIKRKGDFNEIYNEFITDKAKEQSSRCSQCGVPFCQIHCPLGNNIPDWLKAYRRRKTSRSLRGISKYKQYARSLWKNLPSR